MRAPLSVLILGGTTEAMQLARLLKDDARFAATMSFAGRTVDPHLPDLDCRVGGFGGVDGLRRYLTENGIGAVVDATHPFAARMTANAAQATADLAIPRVVLTRPAWQRQPGDSWIEVSDIHAAREALGDTPRTVLLTIGRQEVGVFRDGVAHRYVVRSVDAVASEILPRDARVITARGPFDVEHEMALLGQEGIDIVVSKNSGGRATYAKIEAARQLGLPVIMIARPRADQPGDLHDPAAVVAWLSALRDHALTS